jgi:hypothetical protein
MIPSTLSAMPATTLPRANSASPPMMIGLRPTWSDNQPKGICNSAWVSP